jgi:hypothetical protein
LRVKRAVSIAISIVALILAAALAGHQLVLDAPDAGPVEAVVDRDSVFCRDFLRMTPESRRVVLGGKAEEFLFGVHDRFGVSRCLPEYVMERAAAVERTCRSRGDFDAGSMLGQILVVGLRECRRQAESGEEASPGNP